MDHRHPREHDLDVAARRREVPVRSTGREPHRDPLHRPRTRGGAFTARRGGGARPGPTGGYQRRACRAGIEVGHRPRPSNHRLSSSSTTARRPSGSTSHTSSRFMAAWVTALPKPSAALVSGTETWPNQLRDRTDRLMLATATPTGNIWPRASMRAAPSYRSGSNRRVTRATLAAVHDGARRASAAGQRPSGPRHGEPHDW